MTPFSTIPNRQLMEQARLSLRGKWTTAVLAYFLYVLINYSLRLVFSFMGTGENAIEDIIYFIISGPLCLGLAGLWLAIARGQDARVSQLFDGFNRFGTAIAAYLLIVLLVFLWSLLLIVPGIIAYLSYSQTFFILADDKSIGPLAAVRKSKQMMQGNRLKLFYLWCRFIGWFLLTILSCGIGVLWFGPYFNVSLAEFYDDLLKDMQAVDLS